MADHLAKLIMICLVIVMNTHHINCFDPSDDVNITYVKDAVEKGAVCLDGSPAAYYYDPGFGDGINNWLILLEGGGWCQSNGDCEARLNQTVGSTKYRRQSVYFGQIKSKNRTQNPDFYNSNRIHVAYCDSSSYMGNIDHINITSRGARIFDAIVEELLDRGMSNATNVVLSGASAGGLAAILHCDDFRKVLPHATRVKCVDDSGFFIHAPQLHGAQKRAEYFANVSKYHGFTNKLSPSCTSRMNPSLCVFPEHIVKYIQTPLFLIESNFDQYQLGFHFVTDEPNFRNCTFNLTLCTPSHFQVMKDYGVAVREIFREIRDYTSIAMFVHPCFRHVHLYEQTGWGGSYKLRGKTIAQAVGDWFYDRDSSFQEIATDHKYPLTRNCTKIPNTPNI